MLYSIHQLNIEIHENWYSRNIDDNTAKLKCWSRVNKKKNQDVRTKISTVDGRCNQSYIIMDVPEIEHTLLCSSFSW